MRKNKKLAVSLIILVVFLFSLWGIYMGFIKKAWAVPTPVVYGVLDNYKAGETINLETESTGTSSKVQYKAVLYNETTKKSIDLLNGYTQEYFNPEYKYKLSFKIAGAGKYSLKVTSKRAGNRQTGSNAVRKQFNVEDVENTDTIQAGDMVAPTNYSPAGEFLYFGNIPLNADKINAAMDKKGIPMLKINGKFVYDPVSIAQYGLQEYSYYMKDKNLERMKKVIKAADWLVNNQGKTSGKWHYNFPFAVGGMGITLESGWASAMGQGQAISLLVRAYNYTHEKKYLQTAELGLKPLKKDVKNGGLARDFYGNKYYEEYPTTPPSFALNGFMFTLLGLYDLSIINPQSEATGLYNEGMKTLKSALPYYDGAEEKISYYHLGHITNPPRKVHTSSFYHKVHIIQLTAFASIDPDSIFIKYRDLWKSYIDK